LYGLSSFLTLIEGVVFVVVVVVVVVFFYFFWGGDVSELHCLGDASFGRRKFHLCSSFLENQTKASGMYNRLNCVPFQINSLIESLILSKTVNSILRLK